jgi:hypothetical protein
MTGTSVYIVKSIVLTAVLGLVVSVGCKKSSPQPQQPQTAPVSKTETPAPKPVIPEANIATPKTTDVNSPSGLEPIAIALPRPMFVGTPQNFGGITNLEKPSGKLREPFYAPKGTTNIALHKPVKGSDEQPIIGELKMLTDGDKEAADGSFVELGPGVQNVTIDLGAPHNIYAIVIWHYHKQPRVYKDVVVQVADDADFITNVKTIFNNDNDNSSGFGVGRELSYVETAEGKLIDAKGTVARYVRCSSNGNNANELNNYIEVEVHGIPVK